MFGRHKCYHVHHLLLLVSTVHKLQLRLMGMSLALQVFAIKQRIYQNYDLMMNSQGLSQLLHFILRGT